MCGICGALTRPGSGSPDPEAVEAAADAIVHRGPDHGAVAVLGRCALGYRRLSVIDLATGDQPVTNETGDVMAVMNGEIYGFRSLRERLAANGHRVPGTGDTPIIPHLYEEHGPAFVEHLDGMFAIALWDASRERLVLARDRFGKKPLVWAALPDGTIVFASELKALLRFPGVSPRVRLEALDAYLSLGYVPGETSALEGVRRLPPGHVLVAEGQAVEVVPYWRLEPAPIGPQSDEDWLGAVRDTVRTAVRDRLVADVPLGALLSGGIDSSIVVAAMAQEMTEPVRTFSVGFSDERYDERRFARLVADRYGTRHEEILLEPDAAALLPRLAAAYDEPFADPSALPTFLVCEFARREVTVALVGDGGDEVFGGYDRYRAHALAARFDRLPARLTGGAARAVRLLPSARRELRSTAYRAARLLETAAAPTAERYGSMLEIFPSTLRRSLLTPEVLRELRAPMTAGALLGAPRAPGLTGLQLLDVDTYLAGDLLYKADIASMASSLELRSPLLDHRVAELALALPSRLRIDGSVGKVALRRAFADDLPAEILGRRKAGFGVPIGRWFRGELRELARELLLDPHARARGLFRAEAVAQLLSDHAAGRRDHGARIWALVTLELWHRRWVDHSPPVRVAA